MHEKPKLTIAIDGPSGSGKSSVSKEVARHFGLVYLDTGAMYRAATWYVLERGIDLADAEAISQAVVEMPLVFGTNIKEEEIAGRADLQRAEIFQQCGIAAGIDNSVILPHQHAVAVAAHQRNG